MRFTPACHVGQLYEFELDSSDFAAAIASMQNNNRVPIQIERAERDMYITEVAIEVSAILVPEPTSVALLASGLARIWLFQRRRAVRLRV